MAVAEESIRQQYQPNLGKPPKAEDGERMPLQLVTMTNNQVVEHVSLKYESHKRRRVTISDVYDNNEVKFAVTKRALEIQASLAPEFPSMIKYMLPSTVTGGFCLSLSKQFCDKHLPKEDTIIILEDESGKTYETKYIAHKVGLSAGWRGFSIGHNLLVGDILVFHLVEPTKFKVYIVRANDCLGLMKLDVCLEDINPLNDVVRADNLIMVKEEMDDKVLQPLLNDNPKEKIQKNSMMICVANFGPISDQSISEREDLGFEISDGIRLSEAVVDFKEVKSFEDFEILVNGLVINCELSKHTQVKYYELCCSQKLFLHEHLLEGLNCKLITGIIAEAVNIADAIRASKLATSQDNLVIWEKTLKAFEGLGMNVGFLLARLSQLMSLATISRRQKEARVERFNAEEKIKILEVKLLEVKEMMNRLDVEIKSSEKMENLELMFQKVAEAPW